MKTHKVDSCSPNLTYMELKKFDTFTCQGSGAMTGRVYIKLNNNTLILGDDSCFYASNISDNSQVTRVKLCELTYVDR